MPAPVQGWGGPQWRAFVPNAGIDLESVLVAGNTTEGTDIDFSDGLDSDSASWPNLDNTLLGPCPLFPTFWGIVNDFSDIVMGNAADDSIFHNFFNGARIVFGNVANDPNTSVGPQRMDFLLDPLTGLLIGDANSDLTRWNNTLCFWGPPLLGSYAYHSLFFNALADGIVITQDGKFFGWGAAADCRAFYNGVDMVIDTQAVGTGGLVVTGPPSWNGVSPAPAQTTIVGSRGGNVALADLLTKLAATGIFIDGTVI